MDKTLNFIKKIIPARLFRFAQPAYHYLLSWFSAFIYGYPSEKLIVIGVTGTTGKTTSVYLAAKALEEVGLKVGYTSTAIFNDGKKEWLNNKKMTMVGRFFTQKMLRNMLHNGCQAAIVETTSEGVRQFRHKFINYDILAITGLYPEHIDSHGSFENYKSAKGKLFSHLKNCKVKFVDSRFNVVKTDEGIKKINLKRIKKTIITNHNDEYYEYFEEFWAENKIGIIKIDDNHFEETDNLFKYGNIVQSGKNTIFNLGAKKVKLNLLGGFNATNAMMAFAICKAFLHDDDKIISGLEKIKGVAGRLEPIDEGQNFTVIVDYAFEPNAVNNLYKTIKFINHRKIIHVLGSAGGGRDVSRRGVLGKIAGEKADIMIVTNEDPYDENPEIIIDQVLNGAKKSGKKLNDDIFKILDRRKAIQKALNLASEGDIVLITGKGSEQAIVVKNNEKIPWDDRAVARGLLNNWQSNE